MDSDGSINFAGFVSYLFSLTSPDEQLATIMGLTPRQRGEFFSSLEEAGFHGVAAQFESGELRFRNLITQVANRLRELTPQEQLVTLANLIQNSPSVAGLVLTVFNDTVYASRLHADLRVIAQFMPSAGSFDAQGFLEYLATLAPDEREQFIANLRALEANFSNDFSLTENVVAYIRGSDLSELLTSDDKAAALEALLQLDDETRARLGLPTTQELLDAVFDLLKGSPSEAQVDYARGFLEGWDGYTEAAQLRELQSLIDNLPGSVLGASVASVKQAYQAFHDTMQSRWETYRQLAALVAEVETPEGEGDKSLDIQIGEAIGRVLNSALKLAPDPLEDLWRRTLIRALEINLAEVNFATERAFELTPFADGVLDASGYFFLIGVLTHIAQGDPLSSEWLIDSTDLGRQGFWDPFAFDYEQSRNTPFGGIAYWTGFLSWTLLTLGASGGPGLSLPKMSFAPSIANVLPDGTLILKVTRVLADGTVVVRLVPILKVTTTIGAATDLYSSYSRLRKNLEDLQDTDSAWRVPQQGEDAHHVVPQNHPQAARSREILQEWGIDVDSADNGVGLEKSVHYMTLRRDYIAAVEGALERVNSADEATQLLEDIAWRLDQLNPDNPAGLEGAFDQLLNDLNRGNSLR
jgi:hypothetical protein